MLIDVFIMLFLIILDNLCIFNPIELKSGLHWEQHGVANIKKKNIIRNSCLFFKIWVILEATGLQFIGLVLRMPSHQQIYA